MRWALRRAAAAVCALGVLTATACTTEVTAGNPAAPVNRPLTVGTFGRVSTTDPAAASDTGSTVYALNVFQRLMTVEVGSGALKPDAASDCWFIDEVTYSCGIRRNLSFTNGNELTATDVKFSLERAAALRVPGSSARLLDNIDRIVIPDHDPMRVDIKLKQHDRAFGYALASPAASIVDEDSYQMDELWPQWQQPASSGPFFAEVATLDELLLVRYPRYAGAHVPHMPVVTLKTYTTKEALERAIATRTVDVLWRVPSEMVPGDGKYEPRTLPGATVQRLVWNSESEKRSDPALRAWVRDATTPLRTLASPVPQGVSFAADTFAVGGAKPTTAASGEITLGYDERLPGQAALAARVQQALQPEVTVRLLPDDRAADVWLSVDEAWTNTALAWLQPYVEFPLPERAAEVRRLEMAYRQTDSLPDAERAARDLQTALAEDATVVPLSQSDETFWMTPGTLLDPEKKLHLGPCYQLGVWGFDRA